MIGGIVSCIRTMSMNGSLADQIQEEEIIDIPKLVHVPEPIPEHIPKPVHVPELEFCSSIPSQHSFLRSISGIYFC